jgi:hypothetical protein
VEPSDSLRPLGFADEKNPLPTWLILEIRGLLTR